jgi:hypothetical protein
MSLFPVTATVGVKRFIEGATDPRGNPVKAWADPVDWPVSAVAPGVLDEPGKEDRDLSLEHYTLLAPHGHVNEPREFDRVVLADRPGRDFDVDGVPKDWTHGPFGWAAGVQVTIKRAEG